jgi:hypothetical protein
MNHGIIRRDSGLHARYQVNGKLVATYVSRSEIFDRLRPGDEVTFVAPGDDYASVRGSAYWYARSGRVKLSCRRKAPGSEYVVVRRVR